LCGIFAKDKAFSRAFGVSNLHYSKFLNFAIENCSELFSYIVSRSVNIRICRDITGEVWFGVESIGEAQKLNLTN
jgi:hypothetical protein